MPAHPKDLCFQQCQIVNKDWQAQRLLASALYHNAMAHLVADVNEFCLTDRHYCFADKIARCCEDSGTFSA
jgi:hypothetical protein